MNIVIIGTGNVAAALGRKLFKEGHCILQVIGRNAIAASQWASEWQTTYTTDLTQIDQNAEVYIIAVTDAAIAEVASGLHLPTKVVAHTAAMVPIEVLQHISENYGVLYPLQSLRKEMDTPEIPVYVEAVNDHTIAILNQLSISISGAPARFANFETRARLHIAAVMVNNFTNHIFSVAEDYCKKEGLDFNDFLPLLHNTITRISGKGPAAMQTGPAARKDYETIAKHEKILDGHPAILKLYQCLTESILRQPNV